MTAALAGLETSLNITEQLQACVRHEEYTCRMRTRAMEVDAKRYALMGKSNLRLPFLAQGSLICAYQARAGV